MIMKWFALLLIIAGVLSLAWSIVQERTADLSNLPIVVIGGIAGVVMATVGVIIMLYVMFAMA